MQQTPLTAMQLAEILMRCPERNLESTVRVVVHAPGSVGGTPSAAVISAQSGFDWDSGSFLIGTDEKLTRLSPDDVQAINDSVRKGTSWHAYQSWKKQEDQIAQLQAAHMEELRAYELTVSNLRAELEAVGAGGVQSLRKGQCLHQIAEPSMSNEWAKHVHDAYLTLRQCNQSIPGEVLEQMRDVLLSSAQSGEQAAMNEDGYLPCPFCGSTEVSKSIGNHDDSTPWHYVECENCAATTEPETWNERASSRPAPALEVSQAALKAARDAGINQGVCLALQVMHGFGDADSTEWNHLLKVAGRTQIEHYAKHVDPDEWELCGFAHIERQAQEMEAFAAAQAKEGA